MGNAFDVVMTTPFDVLGSRHERLDDGLRNLGFMPAVDRLDPRGRNDESVWLRLGLKLPTEVGWEYDEDPTEDDSFAGRVTPYSWIHETWRVR